MRQIQKVKQLKNISEYPYCTSLREELYDFLQCSSQLPDYYSKDLESSKLFMSHDEKEDDIGFPYQLKAWPIKKEHTD